MWPFHEMEYYLTIKTSDGLIHASSWMNLENILLSVKKPDTKGHMLCMSPVIGNSQDTQTPRDRKQIGGCQRLGEGEKE